jgi:hypothetical protein
MVRRWRLIGYFPILYNPKASSLAPKLSRGGWNRDRGGDRGGSGRDRDRDERKVRESSAERRAKIAEWNKAKPADDAAEEAPATEEA